MTVAMVEQRRRNNAAIAARRRAATTCGRGHEFTEANTIRRADGRRACRICWYDRGWYYRHGIGWVR